MRRPALALIFLALSAPATAIVGNAPEVPNAQRQPEVMLAGSHGNFCTGTLIARDLGLTAGHCIAPDTNYKLVAFDAQHQAILKDAIAVARHPQFNLKTLFAHRATAD